MPETLYPNLIARICEAKEGDLEQIAQFLASKASDKLLIAIDQHCPDVLTRSLGLIRYSGEEQVSAKLAVRLAAVNNLSLLVPRRSALWEGISDSIANYGNFEFLDVPGLLQLIPNEIAALLKSDIAGDYQSCSNLYENLSQDLSSTAVLDEALNLFDEHLKRMNMAFTTFGLMSPVVASAFQDKFTQVRERLSAKRDEVDDAETERAERRYDEWKDERSAEKWEMENGRFSDVDE